MITIRVNNLEPVQRALNKVVKRHKNMSILMAILATWMKKDVTDHFEKQMSDKGIWARWRDPKSKQKGKNAPRINTRPTKRGGNKMLQDTGKLKTSIRNRSTKRKAEVFTKTTYAPFHQDGTKKMVQRKFMWLSKKTLKRMLTRIKRWGVGK